MDVGKRLSYIRKKRAKTLIEVATYLGVSEATVQRYESGNIKNLKLDTITKIANFLNVNPSYLMGWSNLEENLSLSNSYIYIPDPVSAGPLTVMESVVDYGAEKINLPDAVMGRWAGHDDIKIMRVNGDSMNNVIPDNSLIAVKKIEFSALNNDDIVVFNEDYEYSAKRFYNDAENNRFIFSPDSKDKSFTDHIVDYENANNLVLEGKVVMYIVEQI